MIHHYSNPLLVSTHRIAVFSLQLSNIHPYYHAYLLCNIHLVTRFAVLFVQNLTPELTFIFFCTLFIRDMSEISSFINRNSVYGRLYGSKYMSEIHAFGSRPIYFASLVEKFFATLRFLLLLLGKIESNFYQQMHSFFLSIFLRKVHDICVHISREIRISKNLSIKTRPLTKGRTNIITT